MDSCVQKVVCILFIIMDSILLLFCLLPLGIENENGTFSGSCKGDSGGPLKIRIDERDTLIGTVSGGYGCGLNVPGWYTKVQSVHLSLNEFY